MKSKRPPFTLILLIFLLYLVNGCAAISEMNQKKQFSELSRSYRQAILWSDFEYASEFLSDDLVEKDGLDPVYEQVKVTNFEEKRKVVDPDINTIEQVVDIKYYWIDRMVIKKLTVRQVWEWDQELEKWRLTSGLPIFQ